MKLQWDKNKCKVRWDWWRTKSIVDRRWVECGLAKSSSLAAAVEVVLVSQTYHLRSKNILIQSRTSSRDEVPRVLPVWGTLVVEEFVFNAFAPFVPNVLAQLFEREDCWPELGNGSILLALMWPTCGSLRPSLGALRFLLAFDEDVDLELDDAGVMGMIVASVPAAFDTAIAEGNTKVRWDEENIES